ncbi:MAG: hypothetical protein KF729_12215 [Sandaracinaceae bacterium]|nr:hypothetical protein [Sandaracinaceae bacterium]
MSGRRASARVLWARRLLAALALSVALSVASCAPTPTRDAGVTMDAAPPPDAARPDAQADVEGHEVWTLLVRYARFPEMPPTGSREVAGMDLDQRVTTSTSDALGCHVVDWVAPARYLATAGVDNQSPLILTAIRALNDAVDFNADLLASFARGRALHAIRISRIGHPIDDGGVDVAVFRVEPTAALALEPAVIDGRSLMLLAAGQTFRIHPESLIEGRPRTELRGASLRGGYLHTPGGSFSLRIPASDGGTLHIELSGLRIAGRASETRLEAGLMTGHVRREDVPATIESLNVEPPVDTATVEAIAEQLADLDLDSDGFCEGISIALEIDAVAATLVTP